MKIKFVAVEERVMTTALVSSLDQVANKILLGLIDDLQVPFRIKNRSGKVLQSTAACKDDTEQAALVFVDPGCGACTSFQAVNNKTGASLRTFVEGDENSKPKMVVFNQAEPFHLLLREKPHQGDFVLKLVPTLNLSWHLTNSKENMLVGCKGCSNFVITKQVGQAEELFLEFPGDSLLKRLGSVMDTTSLSVRDRDELLKGMDRVIRSVSDKFLSPLTCVFYSLTSSGVRLRFQSHHKSWLKVDWHCDPPILSATFQKQDPSIEFEIIGFGSLALIRQREHFVNLFSNKCVRVLKDSCYFGLDYDTCSKRVFIFVPWIEEELYLCVTKKQNVELHRKKRAWELFQVFIRKEDVDSILSRWKLNKQSTGNNRQEMKGSQKDFSYSKAIGNVEGKSLDDKVTTSACNRSQSEKNKATTKATPMEPQPRKKKNKRRKNKASANPPPPPPSASSSQPSSTIANDQGDAENTQSSVADHNSTQNGHVASQQQISTATHTSSQVCAGCRQPITSSYASAMGKTFHAECLRCVHCGNVLVTNGDGNFRRQKGKPYCNSCYANYVAPRCAKCLQPILGTVTKAMKQDWHPQCLICTQCNTPLSTTFYLFPELPRHPVCSRCAVGIEQNELRRKQMRSQLQVLPASLRMGTFLPFGNNR